MADDPPPPAAQPAVCPPRPQKDAKSELRPSFMKDAVKKAPRPPK
jgi:hypothetical protein